MTCINTCCNSSKNRGYSGSPGSFRIRYLFILILLSPLNMVCSGALSERFLLFCLGVPNDPGGLPGQVQDMPSRKHGERGICVAQRVQVWTWRALQSVSWNTRADRWRIDICYEMLGQPVVVILLGGARYSMIFSVILICSTFTWDAFSPTDSYICQVSWNHPDSSGSSPLRLIMPM